MSALTEKFGRLTILRDVGIRSGRRHVFCRCECGKTLIVKLNALKTGNKKSCGCLKSEWCSQIGKKNLIHGGTSAGRSPEYKLWHSMIQRCEYPRHISYRCYGAKGISVCKRWRESFSAFLSDMGKRPSEVHTIERIDGKKNYEPSNCRWATQKEQQRNRSSNRILVIDGVSRCSAEWLDLSKSRVSKALLNWRLKSGWDARVAVFTPPGKERNV